MVRIMDISTLNTDAVIASIRDDCTDIFSKKLIDYGPSWLFFRDISLCDQLWIKIRRIRNLEEMHDCAEVDEGREPEFLGIVNYSIIMLMKLRYPDVFPPSDAVVADTGIAERLDYHHVLSCYQACFEEIITLLAHKNHDYGNAWAELHNASLTDLILIKIARIRNILANGGTVLISENVDAQLMDIVNYAIFSIIHLRYDANF